MKTRNTFTVADANDFNALKRAYELDANAENLEALAKACAASVVAKCIDPQRKSATASAKVSDGGYNPAMIKLRRAIQADTALLENTRKASEVRTFSERVNSDGDIVYEKIPHAADRINALIQNNLGDGADLVQTAIVAILEQQSEHGADCVEWLEARYIKREPKRKVLIQREDTAAYIERETTPIQEVFRAVRRAVEETAAVKSASERFIYIDEYADSDNGAEDRLYRRLKLYSDLGGAACNGSISSMAGAPSGHDKGNGLYTAGETEYFEYYELRDKLNLTARQEQILALREKGYGYKAIASYLGVKSETVKTVLKRLQKQVEAAGFMPPDIHK